MKRLSKATLSPKAQQHKPPNNNNNNTLEKNNLTALPCICFLSFQGHDVHFDRYGQPFYLVQDYPGNTRNCQHKEQCAPLELRVNGHLINSTLPENSPGIGDDSAVTVFGSSLD